MWPFSKPKELQAAMAALEIEAEKYNEKSDTLFGINSVAARARDIIESQKEKTIHSIKNRGMSPRALVHLVITNVVYERLVSGELHIYRGILNQEGNDMLKLFRFSSRILVEEGAQTEAKADEDIATLQEQIKHEG